jgi:hypothetical protein
MTHEQRAASVLFSQYETVFHVRGSAVSPDSLAEPPANSSNISFVPFYELRAALKAVPGQDATGLLIGNQALLVGARNFQAPKGLGPVRSQRCYIVVLPSHKILDLNALFRTPPVTSIAGTVVYGWSAQLGEYGEDDIRPTSFYATRVGDNYLIVTNDVDNIREVSDALVSLTDRSHLLRTVRDWNMVSRHSIWGYRRYTEKGKGHGENADPSFPISSAEALIFYVESEKKVAVVTILGAQNKDEEEAIKSNSAARALSFRRHSSKVWTATVALTGAHDASDQLFAALSLFGFGAFV